MTAIEFENISKQYRLGLVSTKTLSHDLNRWWTVNVLGKEDPYLKIGETNNRATKGESDYVWALKDIDFKVEQGDVLGIIGKNGAGKSTLLKILSRVTGPTTGHIRARGRIASLLEVGTGFHPEMTGRENIYMNGAIMGMTKAEISRKLDEIVDFSGCERYLDTPVKRYSSGMTVRLGFAIAAHLDPEILVVDEVLAVGDAEFQKKAIGKMQDVSKGEGRTVLFVSHNMSSIQQLCNKGLLLSEGSVKFSGSVRDTIDEYLVNKNTSKLAYYSSEENTSKSESYFKSIHFENELGNKIDTVLSGDELNIVFEYYSPFSDDLIHVAIYDKMGDKLIHLNTEMVGYNGNKANNNKRVVFNIPQFPLYEGSYSFDFSLVGNNQTHDRVIDKMKLSVLYGDFYKAGKLPEIKNSRFFVPYSCK